MPLRTVPLVTGQYYHVFNQGIDRRVTFRNAREFTRGLLTLWYYRCDTSPMKLSNYLTLPKEERNAVTQALSTKDALVEVLCYCLMNNHFHLLVKQNVDGGLSKYLGQVQNSYTRYFNILSKRKGSLFLERFKAVRIEADEQLLHVSRYIHLNPYTGYVVKTRTDLQRYPWSSFLEYLNHATKISPFCQTAMILDHFKTRAGYRKFVFDQADDQRKLESIRHLTFEEAEEL